MLDTLSQTWEISWVRDLVLLIYGCTIVSIVTIVVSENRNPVKSLAWVTVLLLLPMLGIVLYIVFGRNIKNKRKLSRRNRRKLKRREPRCEVDVVKLGISAENLQHIRLAHALTGAQLYPGNSVEVFTDGTAKFDAFKRDLKTAARYINLEYYIFENDRIGNEVADILIERALAGVKVRVIYDHVGSFKVKTRFFKKMKSAGIEILPFFEVSFPQLGTRINWRNHRKLAVIDGRVGYIGGMNIADRYIDGGKRFAGWRDTHVRVEGPVVSALQFSFAVDWHFMGQPLLDEQIDAAAVQPGNVAAQLVTSGPTSQWAAIAMMLQKAISNAKQRVYIQTPYFLPTDALLTSLINAALAGVDVRIMVPRQSDSPMMGFASSSYVSECLRAGIKFYLYEAGMLHSKLMLVDGDFVTIGSTNFDFRSFEHNFEGNLFFYSAQLNAQVLAQYREDLKASTRILPAQWRRRSIIRRSLESIVRLLSPIL